MITQGNFTTYDPNKGLHEQVAVRSRVQVVTEAFVFREITFKALKVNDLFLDISVSAETTINESSKENCFVFDKLTFAIKSKDSNEIDIKEISEKDIDQKIKEIFEKSTRNN